MAWITKASITRTDSSTSATITPAVELNKKYRVRIVGEVQGGSYVTVSASAGGTQFYNDSYYSDGRNPAFEPFDRSHEFTATTTSVSLTTRLWAEATQPYPAGWVTLSLEEWVEAKGWVKVDGTWRQITGRWVKVNGQWRQVVGQWVKVDGQWRQA